MVPQLARDIIGIGVRATALRLKSNIGTTWSAPYIGSVHRKTAKNRSIEVYAQLAMCGCEAAHGPYGGSTERQTSRAAMFPGCRSFQCDRSVIRGGNLMVEGKWGHTGRERMRCKSIGSKVRVRTMSRFRDVASFGICPAVLILSVQNEFQKAEGGE
jgi:hypothetical protein